MLVLIFDMFFIPAELNTAGFSISNNVQKWWKEPLKGSVSTTTLIFETLSVVMVWKLV